MDIDTTISLLARRSVTCESPARYLAMRCKMTINWGAMALLWAPIYGIAGVVYIARCLIRLVQGDPAFGRFSPSQVLLISISTVLAAIILSAAGYLGLVLFWSPVAVGVFFAWRWFGKLSEGAARASKPWLYPRS